MKLNVTKEMLDDINKMRNIDVTDELEKILILEKIMSRKRKIEKIIKRNETE